MAERFYINCPLAPGPVVLQGPEAHHLTHVLRARPGDLVSLFNGDGHEYSAEVSRVERRQLELSIRERLSPQRELDFQLIVASPVPKGDRAQFLIEKLTELGTTCFVPLSTRRSIVEPREMKRARFERWVIESSKQCGRNVLMMIEAPTSWESFCQRSDLPAKRFVAHVGAGDKAIDQGSIVFAVGPEGGFTEEEIQHASLHGWQPIGLGPRVLRIETAAVALATMAVYGGK